MIFRRSFIFYLLLFTKFLLKAFYVYKIFLDYYYLPEPEFISNRLGSKSSYKKGMFVLTHRLEEYPWKHF